MYKIIWYGLLSDEAPSNVSGVFLMLLSVSGSSCTHGARGGVPFECVG